MATMARSRPGSRAIAARVGAVAVAMWWAGPFFGIIDLLVVLTPSERREFFQYLPLETSWGLLYSVLVPVPLLAWAVRPVPWVGPAILAVAVSVLVAGLVFGSPGQVFVGLLVAASAGFARMWRPRLRWSLRRAFAAPALWPLDALVALAAGAAAVHAWDVVAVARGPFEDDETWALMHLPMHAAFALAVPVTAAVAVLALANGAGGWWFAVVPPSASSAWFGVVSMQYPSHVVSLGTAGGIGAVCWGVALAGAVWGLGASGMAAGRPGRPEPTRDRRT